MAIIVFSVSGYVLLRPYTRIAKHQKINKKQRKELEWQQRATHIMANFMFPNPPRAIKLGNERIQTARSRYPIGDFDIKA
jgi:hypothetical protein